MNEVFSDVTSSRPAAKRTGPPRIVFILLVGLIAIVIVWCVPFGQRYNLRVAQKHANLIRPQVSEDPRFQKVKVEPYTGVGGCLWIGGAVNSKEDGDALRTMIASTHPPVLTLFRVFLYPPPKEGSGMVHLANLVPGGS